MASNFPDHPRYPIESAATDVLDPAANDTTTSTKDTKPNYLYTALKIVAGLIVIGIVVTLGLLFIPVGTTTIETETLTVNDPPESSAKTTSDGVASMPLHPVCPAITDEAAIFYAIQERYTADWGGMSRIDKIISIQKVKDDVISVNFTFSGGESNGEAASPLGIDTRLFTMRLDTVSCLWSCTAVGARGSGLQTI